MNKKKVKIFICIGVVSSILFFVKPENSYAKSTTMTITFSDFLEQETIVDLPSTPPLIKYTKIKKEYKVRSNHRLPLTGEEYNLVRSNLGWTILVSTLFFFFMGKCKQQGRRS